MITFCIQNLTLLKYNIRDFRYSVQKRNHIRATSESPVHEKITSYQSEKLHKTKLLKLVSEMGVKVVVVDMNVAMTRDTVRLLSRTLLQEISLFVDQSAQSGLMLACLAAHTEVQI
jgi:uncharacterized protein (UPF0264 family)